MLPISFLSIPPYCLRKEKKEAFRVYISFSVGLEG
jgi:hypothetical protein